MEKSFHLLTKFCGSVGVRIWYFVQLRHDNSISLFKWKTFHIQFFNNIRKRLYSKLIIKSIKLITLLIFGCHYVPIQVCMMIDIRFRKIEKLLNSFGAKWFSNGADQPFWFIIIILVIDLNLFFLFMFRNLHYMTTMSLYYVQYYSSTNAICYTMEFNRISRQYFNVWIFFVGRKIFSMPNR